MDSDKQKGFFIKVCFYIFFTSLVFESSLWMIYLTEIGYSISLIAIVQIFYSVALLCFEYLSGFLADKFGRKRMLILANICICIYTITMLFVSKVFLVFIAYFIYAFGVAIISSVDQSLVYDNLNSKQKNNFLKFSSIMQGVATMAFFIQDSISGQIVTYINWSWVFFMTCGTHIIAVIILFIIKDKHQEKIDEKPTELRKTLKKEFYYKKELYLLIILFAFLQGSVSIMFIYGQTILKHFSFSTSKISIVYALTNLVGVIVLIFVSLIKKLNWNIFCIVLLIISCVLSCFFTTSNSYFFVTIFIFLDLTLTIMFTHLMNIVNKIIISTTRATIIAIMNVSSSLTMIGFQIIFVLYDDFTVVKISIFVFLLASMVISIICFGWYLLFFPKTKDKKILKLETKIKKIDQNKNKKKNKKRKNYENYINYLKEY